jgi:hypothetical protein
MVFRKSTSIGTVGIVSEWCTWTAILHLMEPYKTVEHIFHISIYRIVSNVFSKNYWCISYAQPYERTKVTWCLPIPLRIAAWEKTEIYNMAIVQLLLIKYHKCWMTRYTERFVLSLILTMSIGSFSHGTWKFRKWRQKNSCWIVSWCGWSLDVCQFINIAEHIWRNKSTTKVEPNS